MRLENKVAIVTGAAQGLGRSMTKKFVGEGAKVIAIDLKSADYESDQVIPYALDVTDRKACSAFSKWLVENNFTVDILVNNAGVTQDALLNKMTDDQWDLVIDVNLNGIYNLTKHIGPMMMNNQKGSIINIASVVGEFGNIGQSNYAATKSAIYGITKTWAKEFSRKGEGVRVNAISPGYTMTDILKTVPDELLEKFAKMTMLKRLAQPEEIANAALFLASDEASYITGHNLSVNGGMRL
jgi:3-oxoacyl-[acyl-carrier protein] reductase